jgi:hypothetical protein
MVWTALLQELWEVTDEPASRVVGVEHLCDVVDHMCVTLLLTLASGRVSR